MAANDRWRTTFPGAIAALVRFDESGTPPVSEALDAEKRRLETELRERHAGQDRATLRGWGPLPAYDHFYRGFGQNYHVGMQIESIALKGKTIPSRAAVVEAMFMTELATGLLLAIHDAAVASLPVRLDVTTGEEHYTRYDGVEEHCKPNDMAMFDAAGHLLTSVIQGPTTHARVEPPTSSLLLALYAPAGIGRLAARNAIDTFARYLALAAPAARLTGETLLEAPVS